MDGETFENPGDSGSTSFRLEGNGPKVKVPKLKFKVISFMILVYFQLET